MEIKLPNGLTISGTEAQVRELARTLGYATSVPTEGDGVHYRSTAHGLIKIRDMNTQHLVNAVRKRYRMAAENLPSNRLDLLSVLRVGVGSTDVTLLSLINELRSRRD